MVWFNCITAFSTILDTASRPLHYSRPSERLPLDILPGSGRLPLIHLKASTVTDFSGKLLPWQNIARVVFFGVPFVCVPGWVVGASVYGIWAKGWRGWLRS